MSLIYHVHHFIACEEDAPVQEINDLNDVNEQEGQQFSGLMTKLLLKCFVFVPFIRIWVITILF